MGVPALACGIPHCMGCRLLLLACLACGQGKGGDDTSDVPTTFEINECLPYCVTASCGTLYQCEEPNGETWIGTRDETERFD